MCLGFNLFASQWWFSPMSMLGVDLVGGFPRRKFPPMRWFGLDIAGGWGWGGHWFLRTVVSLTVDRYLMQHAPI